MACIIDMDKWDRVKNKYIFPLTPLKNNWYDLGLIPKNDFTADVFGFFAFTFETELHGTAEIIVTAELLDFGEVHSEELADYYTWRCTASGDGIVKITAPLSQFDIPSCAPARWRFLRSLEINRPVSRLAAVKGAGVCAEARVASKSAEAGETIAYDIEIANCLDAPQAVTFNFARTGYETLTPYMRETELVLKPREERRCRVEVVMNDKIVPGGFEKHVLNVIPNGDGAKGNTIELYSVRRLKHPYIANTQDGWDAVSEKIRSYEWAKKIADTYIKRAEEWEVPHVGNINHGMFKTAEGHKCYNAAIAYKLTGNRSLAEKSALFLKRLTGQDGYPARRKAGSQQLVHEGEFFKSCAMAYDLICDAGVLNEEEAENVLYSFRLFVDLIDWELTDGGISNWALAEIAGALYCAMDLQDMEKIRRFVYGTGGILAHLRAGVYSDGWWCECTIGYNQMAAGLFSEYTQALRPWGINIASTWVPAQYSDKVHLRNQSVDGLSWDIYGTNSRNYRCIEDLWDSLVPMANYRSIAQGVNDSAEEIFRGASPVAFDSRYDIAYAIYHKPEYAQIIRRAGEGAFRDLLHGEGELPLVKNDTYKRSAYFDNGGIMLLRSNSEGAPDRERIEIGLKYGSHGGAHGHYDRCALNAVSRFGKSLFNPENVWYSYSTFMYKFFVQNSINHNMTTVDLKQQDPSENKRLLFHDGELFKAGAVETLAKWANPPYGGWKVISDESFEDRTWIEGRYVPIPDDAPEYARRTDFTEPVLQRRLAVVTDEYIACFDFIGGDAEHDYHCVYHLPGFKGAQGDIKLKGSSEQLSDDPVSSAQFITETETSDCRGTVKLSFSYEFGEELSGKAPWLSEPFRSGHNETGRINADLYYAGKDERELVLGCDPQYAPVSKRLFYRVEADGEVLTDGAFGAWILGREHIEEDIRGKKTLRLCVKTEDGDVEIASPADTVRTIFWGDPYFVTKSGERIYLADVDYTTENVDEGFGAGRDYAGGPVKIQGREFKRAVPGDVKDKSREAVISVDLNGLNAVSFVSDIGGDYPVGDESGRRRFIAEKKRGKSARFASVLEPYEDRKMISGVEYESDDKIVIKLTDGRRHVIETAGLEADSPSVTVREYGKDGQLIREEASEK